ncbi:MAG: DUF1801 domain-containing protein, partial [Meiothermus sp.]|nr:DUF1801 domain-containing protein [Meiothermus sp.]
MAKAEAKTKQTDSSVQDFLAAVPDQTRRKDALAVLELMREVTGLEPKMWGSSIVGFGSYHYKYASGHQGDSPLIGFSPRKQDLTLYINSGFERHAELMEKLGKYKTGKVCLYVKKLTDLDLPTLRELVRDSFEHTRQTTQCEACS